MFSFPFSRALNEIIVNPKETCQDHDHPKPMEDLLSRDTGKGKGGREWCPELQKGRSVCEGRVVALWNTTSSASDQSEFCFLTTQNQE